MEDFTISNGQRLHIHNRGICTPPCAFHAPSQHHMRNWSMLWRDDRHLLERLCEHGVGHPDPDQLEHLHRIEASSSYIQMQSMHGCDGCCRKVNSA